MLEPRLKMLTSRLKVVRGQRVLDIGCGRGELVYWAASKGAESTGIDYSKVAISLAKKAQKKYPQKIKSRTNFHHMDAKKLKFPDKSFDLVIMVEVLEHLYPAEQELIFSEATRVLKKNGKVLIHTAPSKWFQDYTYRWWCYPLSTFITSLWRLLTGKKYGNLAPWGELRNDYHRQMHVNEPDYFSLKKLFKKYDLRGEIVSTNITVLKPELSWKDSLFNKLIYLYPWSNKFPLNVLWGNDFLAVLKK